MFTGSPRLHLSFGICLKQCCQLFAKLFGQSEKKNSAAEEKFRSPSNFTFLKEFGPQKNIIFVCVSGKITIFLGHLPRIIGYEEGNNFLKIQPLFSPFLFKISQNLAAQLPGHSPFYSTFFDLYGRNIGQSTLAWSWAGGDVKEFNHPLPHHLRVCELATAVATPRCCPL